MEANEIVESFPTLFPYALLSFRGLKLESMVIFFRWKEGIFHRKSKYTHALVSIVYQSKKSDEIRVIPTGNAFASYVPI